MEMGANLIVGPVSEHVFKMNPGETLHWKTHPIKIGPKLDPR